MHHREIVGAIVEAMEDWLGSDGAMRPHNPAICRDARGYYYGSALHGDEVVVSLEGGFGAWEPETADEIRECADGLAEEVQRG